MLYTIYPERISFARQGKLLLLQNSAGKCGHFHTMRKRQKSEGTPKNHGLPSHCCGLNKKRAFRPNSRATLDVTAYCRASRV